MGYFAAACEQCQKKTAVQKQPCKNNNCNGATATQHATTLAPSVAADSFDAARTQPHTHTCTRAMLQSHLGLHKDFSLFTHMHAVLNYMCLSTTPCIYMHPSHSFLLIFFLALSV